MTSTQTAALLSRPTAVDDIPDDGLRVRVDPTVAEMTELARLNGLPAVNSLEARFLLRREARGGVWVSGEVVAMVVQVCVLSLDPFDDAVREEVDVHYLPEAALEAYRVVRAKRAPDPSDDDEQEDEPDLIVNGTIDLGHLTAEYLTLGLDPYPKKPGLSFEDVAPATDETVASPFAALKALRQDDA